MAIIRIAVNLISDCLHQVLPPFYLNDYDDIIIHYNDVIMDAMESQITSLTIVFYQAFIQVQIKENIKAPLRVTGLCEGNSPGTGEFRAQRASNAENVSIWYKHKKSDKNFPFDAVLYVMMTWWKGNAFRITGPLSAEVPHKRPIIRSIDFCCIFLLTLILIVYLCLPPIFYRKWPFRQYIIKHIQLDCTSRPIDLLNGSGQ